MPRIARHVVPGVAHHVTQRGNPRQQTFFEAADYVRYVDLLREGCKAADVEVLAWCLMPNHVHLLLVPKSVYGLSVALSSAHQRYTWLVNRRNGWQGYLWQSRFFSVPLDEAHLRLCMRYVELNPVRARLAASPEEWRWSSAKAHVTGRGDRLVSAALPRAVADVRDWNALLAEGLTADDVERIRSLHLSGKPRGRPPKAENRDTGKQGHTQFPLLTRPGCLLVIANCVGPCFLRVALETR